jgi:site-specific DNA-cytosine methylase
MRTLILNSYAGSLTIGAHRVGADIIGSYEDSNFGLDIQKANFPGLNYVEYLKDWPAQDLSEVLTIAHPPCSAFSVQNCSAKARGVDSDAFKCTIKVVDYVARNNGLAIAIESVMGALGGAWNTHQQLADDNGYDLYRVLQNGCMFGSQWRERYWSIYIKKGATPSNVLELTLKPHWQTVGEAVAGREDGPSSGNQDVLLERQKAKLRDIAGLTPAEMDYLFDGTHNFGTRALGAVLFDYKFRTPTSTAQDKWEMFKKYIGGFASGTMCYLDPNGLAPVLMGGSHWYLNGRNVSEDAFAGIGGFPLGYVFPETPRNYRHQQRMYISKGVMPPVAAWILEQVTAHLGERVTNPVTGDGLAYHVECEPNHIADFRISKEGWKKRAEGLPELRGFDEQPQPTKAFVQAPVEPVVCTCRVEGEGVGDVVITGCPVHDRPAPPEKVKKERAPKPPKPEGERVTRPRTRGNVAVVPGVTVEDKRRKVIYEYLLEYGQGIENFPGMAHDDLVVTVAEKLNIESKTAHWHVQQMKKAGQLKDV